MNDKKNHSGSLFNPVIQQAGNFFSKKSVMYYNTKITKIGSTLLQVYHRDYPFINFI